MRTKVVWVMVVDTKGDENDDNTINDDDVGYCGGDENLYEKE